jgi:hypothetical protein
MHHVLDPEPAGNGRWLSIPARYGEEFVEIGTIRYVLLLQQAYSCPSDRTQHCIEEIFAEI